MKTLRYAFETLFELEDRYVPATQMVFNTADSGAGSFRAALAAAVSGDTVAFNTDPSLGTDFDAGTHAINALSGITLTQPVLTIVGPGADQLTYQRGNTSLFSAFSQGANSQLTISGITFGGALGTTGFNSSTYGGFFRNTASPFNLQLDHCTVKGNKANAHGGAIYFYDGGSLTLNHSTLSGNSAGSYGGAVYCWANTVTVLNSTIAGNTGRGGGLSWGSSSAGARVIRNSTIVGNSSTQSGYGGGLRATAGSFTIESSIIAGNTTLGAALDFTLPAATTVATHSAWIAANATPTGAGSGKNVVGDLAGMQLGALQNNGGPTPTISLGSTSTLLDAGSNSQNFATDQRDLPRVNFAVDIGAVEAGAYYLPTAALGVAPTVTLTSPSAFDPYQFTVTYTGNAGLPIVAASVRSPDNKANAITVTNASAPAFSGTAHWVSDDSGGLNQPIIRAVYQMDALPDNGTPNAWDFPDNGTYSVRMSPTASIQNESGNLVANESAGAFTVAVPIPTAVASGPTVTLFSPSAFDPYQFTVTFSGNGGLPIDAASVRAAGNKANAFTISGPNSYSGTAHWVSDDSGGIDQPVIRAVYRIDVLPDNGSPNAWNAPDNGTYTVNLSAASTIRAAGGSVIPAGPKGTFTVAVPVPTAAAAAPTVYQASPSIYDPYRFTVTYTGLTDFIDFASIRTAANKANAIFVASSNPLYSGKAHWVSDDSGDSNQQVIRAVYEIDTLPDNGSPNAWSTADNGVYLVVISGASTISTATGVKVPAGTIGNFSAYVPSFLVTNTNDSGAGSLRQAITYANNVPGPDTITFSDGSNGTTNFNVGMNTITFASALPAFTASGGAIVINGPGADHLTLTSSFSGRAMSDSGGSNFTLRGVTLNGFRNTSHGGLARLTSAGNWTFNDCVISGNSAGSYGGGVFYLSGGSSSLLTFSNCTISGNTATSGRGGFLYGYDDFGTITISQCTIVQNSAPGLSGSAITGGGALAFNDATGTVNISNSTLADNAVSNAGGAIGFSDGALVFNITNSILSRNKVGAASTAATADIAAVSGTALWNVNYCAIGTVGGAPPTVTFSSTSGNNILNANLMLPDSPMLADNGGPLPTIMTPRTSPVVDAGPPGTGSPTATDQRGSPRYIGRIDIGAVEQNAPVAGFVINDGDSQRSRLTKITVNFTQAVHAAQYQGIGNITLTRTAGSGPGIVTRAHGMNISPTSGLVNSIDLTFDNIVNVGLIENGSLADGYWRLAVYPSGYFSPFNDPELRRLFGDLNGDGTVNGAVDFAAFGNAFNQSVGSDPDIAAFDFNHDGVIDGAIDFPAFGARFNLTL